MAVLDEDVLRVTCNFTLHNDVQYQNVYHYVADFTSSQSDVDVKLAIKGQVQDMYIDLVANVKSTTVAALSFIDVIKFVVDEWKVDYNVGTFTPTFSPTNVGEVTPNQIAPFITFKTSRPKTVGRKFLFPPVEGDQAEGILSASYITAVTNFAGEVTQTIVISTGNDLVPVVVRTGINSYLVIQDTVITNLVGTQRRRRPGYGA